MPWVLRETFAAGGLALEDELDLVSLEPFYRIHWAQEDRHLDVLSDRDAMREEIAKFSARDARAFDGFLEALRPIYEDGILAAGRRSFDSPLSLAALMPRLIRLGAALPLHTFVSRHFKDPRIREAMGFHSLFIGGDPFRVPAIYGALVYLQFLDGVQYARGGVYALVTAMARHLDVRCGERVERVEHRGGRVVGVVTAGGELHRADAVVWNGDAIRLDEVLGVRPPVLRTRRTTMSALLLYLGTDRQFPRLRHHTLMVGSGYRRFIKDVTARRTMPATYSTYIHAPSRTEPEMAAPGGDSIAILLPVPNLRSGDAWDAAQTAAVGDAVIADLESTFGLGGLAASTVVRHEMTPADFRDRLGAVDGNAFAIEPTLHQSAAFRVPNRHRSVRGVYAVGAGSHRGPACRGAVRRRGHLGPGAGGCPAPRAGGCSEAGGVTRSAGGDRVQRAGRLAGGGAAESWGRGRGLAGRRGMVARRRAADARRPTSRPRSPRQTRPVRRCCARRARRTRGRAHVLAGEPRPAAGGSRRRAPAVPRAAHARRCRRPRRSWSAEVVIGAVERWGADGSTGSREALILDELARRYPIERAVVADFCAGMRGDLAFSQPADEAELDAYCYRVAGTVGLLMTAILGADDPAAARGPAIALGQAMQRTNILRDIDEDLAAGRIYLPRDTLARFGDSLLPGDRADLLRDQIARADALYDLGIAGLSHLHRGQRSIAAAAPCTARSSASSNATALGGAPGRAVVPLTRRMRAAVGAQRQVGRGGVCVTDQQTASSATVG